MPYSHRKIVQSNIKVLVTLLVIYLTPPGRRLLGVPESAGAQQALPRARGGRALLHRAAQVPLAGPAGGALPARAHLHQQAGREAVPRAPAASGRLTLPELAFKLTPTTVVASLNSHCANHVVLRLSI